MYECIYIYIYTCIGLYVISAMSTVVRSTETSIRVLEYGVRFSTEIYGSKREKTFFHKCLPENWFCSFRHLRKSPETSGSLRENVI